MKKIAAVVVSLCMASALAACSLSPSEKEYLDAQVKKAADAAAKSEAAAMRAEKDANRAGSAATRAEAAAAKAEAAAATAAKAYEKGLRK